MDHDSTGPRVSTTRADKAGAATAGYGATDPAVVELPEPERLPEPTRKRRGTETYEATDPAGRTVVVERDLETGESEIIG
ncbi:hypothetical protein [Actinomycetospora flava]|uniref:YD repeat-containing protein n=1 Tax=Actinomycetospora flava TaxID=3129232 RepID=A0ABU8MGP4_9PSEU